MPPYNPPSTFVIYNPKTRKRYYRKSLFKVNFDHKVLGWIKNGRLVRA